MEGASTYVPAAYNGGRATLAALRRLGVPWGPGDKVAEIVQHVCRALPVLRWLVEQGAPVGSELAMEDALEAAMERGLSVSMVAWLQGLAVGQVVRLPYTCSGS